MAATRSTTAGGPAGGNVVVVWGTCPGGVEVRVLGSGVRVASLALTAPVPGRTGATSVPVTVWDPPAWVEGIEPGDEIVVVGAVRRRFFTTTAGGRGSKVEVEAAHVARATPAQRARTRARAEARLAGLDVR